MFPLYTKKQDINSNKESISTPGTFVNNHVFLMILLQLLCSNCRLRLILSVEFSSSLMFFSYRHLLFFTALPPTGHCAKAFTQLCVDGIILSNLSRLAKWLYSALLQKGLLYILLDSLRHPDVFCAVTLLHFKLLMTYNRVKMVSNLQVIVSSKRHILNIYASYLKSYDFLSNCFRC